MNGLRAVAIKFAPMLDRRWPLMTGPIHPISNTVHAHSPAWHQTASALASMTSCAENQWKAFGVAPLPLLLGLGLPALTLPIAAAELRREAIALGRSKLH